jgi:xanthine dehydrogenase accessory factor
VSDGPVSLADAAAAAGAAVAGGPAVAIVVVIEPASLAGARLLCHADGRIIGTLGDAALDAAGARLGNAALAGAPAGLHAAATGGGAAAALYAESHFPPERLVIVGAGHIAVPLADLGVRCGFRVLVLDDREEFATTERFAAGVEVRRADFDRDPFAGVTFDARTSVALVTRGHRWDFDCLTRLLDAPAAPRYIGMIGSRRRVRAAFLALRRGGVPRRALASIHAPIGLDIGAETPAEIAVSIMAELIQVRRGGEADSLAQRARVLDRLLPETGESGADQRSSKASSADARETQRLDVGVGKAEG